MNARSLLKINEPKLDVKLDDQAVQVSLSLVLVWKFTVVPVGKVLFQDI